VKRALGAALAGALAACSSGLHSSAPAEQTYVLRAPPAAQQSTTGSAHMRLRVLRPLAAPGLGSDRIALVAAGNRLDFLAASRWAAPLPDMLEALAVQTFAGSGGPWSIVEDSRGSLAEDYFLQLTVRRFEADYTQRPDVPTVHVELDCVLGRRDDRTVVASFLVESTQDAMQNRVSSIVAAFEQAADTALVGAAQRAAAALKSATSPAPP
jgi:ABC-type uncharacterized transport system auxiliary subunit